MSLNEQQKLFAYEYWKDFNATQAAIRAGYSEDTAYSQGSRLLKHVEVKALLRTISDGMAAEQLDMIRRVINELSCVGLLDPSDLLTASGELDILRMPESARRAIGGFEVIKDRDGTIRHKVKLIDKVKALDLIGRHFAMFTDKQIVEGGGKPLQIEVVTGINRAPGEEDMSFLE